MIAIRRAGLAAAVATAAVAAVSLSAPANAATVLVSTSGEATVLLTYDDIQGMSNVYAADDLCVGIVRQVDQQREVAGVSKEWTYPACELAVNNCFARVGYQTQVHVWADNTYSCSNYSFDTSIFLMLARHLLP